MSPKTRTTRQNQDQENETVTMNRPSTKQAVPTAKGARNPQDHLTHTYASRSAGQPVGLNNRLDSDELIMGVGSC